MAQAFFLLLLGGCAAAPLGFPVAELERDIRYCGEYRHYVRLAGPKALAVAGDPCRVFVSGLAYRTADADEAERVALALCEQRRADRRVAAPCRIHASGACPTAANELRYCREVPAIDDRCAPLPVTPAAECSE